MAREPRLSLGRKGLIIAFFALLGMGLPFVLSAVPELEQAVTYAVAVFGSEEDYGARQDLSILESVEERLISMPRDRVQELVDQDGPLGVLVGGGYARVGTSLVRPGDGDFVTSHNGYVDLLLIGGLAHLCAFLGLLGSVMAACWRWGRARRYTGASDRMPLVLLGVVVLGAVNYLFAGMLTYQPNMSTLFWLAVGCCMGWKARSEVPHRSAPRFHPAQAAPT